MLRRRQREPSVDSNASLSSSGSSISSTSSSSLSSSVSAPIASDDVVASVYERHPLVPALLPSIIRQCDICGVSVQASGGPILSLWHRCPLGCPFDACQKCFDEGHRHHVVEQSSIHRNFAQSAIPVRHGKRGKKKKKTTKQCDGCGAVIDGQIWKCTQCNKFAFCATCQPTIRQHIDPSAIFPSNATEKTHPLEFGCSIVSPMVPIAPSILGPPSISEWIQLPGPSAAMVGSIPSPFGSMPMANPPVLLPYEAPLDALSGNSTGPSHHTAYVDPSQVLSLLPSSDLRKICNRYPPLQKFEAMLASHGFLDYSKIIAMTKNDYRDYPELKKMDLELRNRLRSGAQKRQAATTAAAAAAAAALVAAAAAAKI